MALCRLHRARGIEIAATRLVGKAKVPMCTSCWNNQGQELHDEGALVIDMPQAALDATPANMKRVEIGAPVHAGMNERQEEKKMPLVKHVDRELIRRLNAEGLPSSIIAERAGCAKSVVGYHLKKMGIKPNGVRRNARANHGAAPARTPRAAIVKAEAQPLAPIEHTPEAKPADGNGRARCRVVMFEVEGDGATILSGIEAVKIALENRK